MARRCICCGWTEKCVWTRTFRAIRCRHRSQRGHQWPAGGHVLFRHRQQFARTALLAQDMPGAFGLMFANFTLDGDIAVSRTNTADDANALFDHCQIIGRTGPAVECHRR